MINLLKTINDFFAYWEPFWLFALIFYEGYILTVDHFFNRQIDAEKKLKRRKSKRVKVIIDSDGNAKVSEAPKGLDISIEHKGE